MVERLLVITFLVSCAWPANAGPPIVPGFERWSDTANLQAGGEILFGELHCTSCHRAEGQAAKRVVAAQAPVLTDVAQRVKPDWLRRYLADPHAVKPGTTMPDVVAQSAPTERAKAAAAITAFLTAALPAGPRDGLVETKSAERGRRLFAEIGCVACHGHRDTNARPVTAAVPLPDLAAKYTVASLSQFLLDPLHARPAGRMPNFGLTEVEARDLANSFLENTPARPNLHFTAYEGEWDKLPDFAALSPKRQGTATGFDLHVVRRLKNTAMRFEGVFHIRTAGDYTLRLGSDDGSRLLIDGEAVLALDGIHAFESKDKKKRLEVGDHAIVVEWFNADGDAELKVQVKTPGPNRAFQDLGALLDLPGRVTAPFESDMAQIDAGRKLFMSLGCASCHEFKENGHALASIVNAKPLAALRPGHGCVTHDHVDPSPHYQLSARQRSACDAFLSGLATHRAPTAAVQLRHALATLNCYACHNRDGVGVGLPTAPLIDDDGRPDRANPADDIFRTAMAEMGDEGRVPPPLDGVGAKIASAYLRQLLQIGAKDRPYMLTRMPGFGSTHANALAPLLEQLDLDKLAPHRPSVVSVEQLKVEGRLLVGTKGLACVKCHNFNREKAEGIPGIDLTVLAKRVRPEWFHAYMRDPQSIRSGTRMPNAWPKDGPSQITDVLGGDSDRQIDAVWEYLKDGSKAAPPFGIGKRQPIELVVDREPIVYRNFIEHAGSRGIAVGYPEKVNLALSAEECRLAVIWKGAFLDVSGHRTSRGGKIEGPLGTAVRLFPAGPAFASLPTIDAPWPKPNECQFRGYRYDAKRRPTIQYQFREIEIDDHFEPTPTGLKRTMSFRAAQSARALTLRAATGQITAKSDGSFVVGGMTLRFSGGQPRLRSVVGQQELLVDIECNALTTLVQEIVW